MAGRSGDGVELNVFVLSGVLAGRSKRKSPSKRVNWNSATRRVARLAHRAKQGVSGVRTRVGNRGKRRAGASVQEEGKRERERERERERAAKEYLLPSSLPLAHRFPARTCKHLLTI